MLKPDELYQKADEMRASPTHAESHFAKRLTKARLQFESQRVVGFYIADFVIPSKMLIIEVDGPIHSHRASQLYDKQRTRFLKKVGFHVLRLQNRQVGSYPIENIIDRSDRPEQVFIDALAKAQRQYDKELAIKHPAEMPLILRDAPELKPKPTIRLVKRAS